GGGSSDCAAMLRLLNELHENAVSQNDLHTIAASLGSDVPFFLTGSTCLATGRGEIITPLPSLPAIALVLVKPLNLEISAKKSYDRIKQSGYRSGCNWQDWETVLKHPDINTLSPLLKNDFNRVLLPAYPQLQEGVDLLKASGIRNPIISGSGPVIFGL